jgi:hypothetical protein
VRCASYDKWDDRIDGGVLRVRATQEEREHHDDANSIQCAALDDDENDWPEHPRRRDPQRFSRIEDPPSNCAYLTVRQTVGKGT